MLIALLLLTYLGRQTRGLTACHVSVMQWWTRWHAYNCEPGRKQWQPTALFMTKSPVGWLLSDWGGLQMAHNVTEFPFLFFSLVGCLQHRLQCSTDCGVWGLKVKSHRQQLCVSHDNHIQYTTFGRTCTHILHCLGWLSAFCPPCKGKGKGGPYFRRSISSPWCRPLSP